MFYGRAFSGRAHTEHTPLQQQLHEFHMFILYVCQTLSCFRCISCHGRGFKVCPSCEGLQNLIHFLQLTVVWWVFFCLYLPHTYSLTNGIKVTHFRWVIFPFVQYLPPGRIRDLNLYLTRYLTFHWRTLQVYREMPFLRMKTIWYLIIPYCVTEKLFKKLWNIARDHILPHSIVQFVL